MFDPKEALKLLVEDRRDYIKKCISFANDFMERDMDEAAMTAIITAGDELKKLDGSIQYVTSLMEYEEYPRFGTIFL